MIVYILFFMLNVFISTALSVEKDTVLAQTNSDLKKELPVVPVQKEEAVASKLDAEPVDNDPRMHRICLLPEEKENGNTRIVMNPDADETAVIGTAVRPATATDNPADAIEINFDNAELQNVLNWIADVFKVDFLSEDAVNPPPPNAKVVSGNKITFKTQKPLTKRQVWDLFLTFLDLFGLTLVKSPTPNLYKVVNTDPKLARSANRSPLNAFINVKWSCIPETDERIRYIYFIRNSSLATLQGLIDSFRSTTSTLSTLPDLNAFVLTDKALNVRAIMQLVEELDSTSSPEALSVLKLQHADAEEVKTFYENLTKTEDPRGLAARILGAKKTPSAIYFPDNTRVFAERRTNTLIILGTQEGIQKVEDFIINYVDTEIKVPYSPLYIYELQYTKAEDMATILANVTKFAADSPAAQSGGVRDGDKYLRPMTFQPEPSGNRLLISCEKEDYLKVREIIKQLDVKQPQIAVEVLIVNATASDDRELGVQIRNKNSAVFGNGINAQTSGFPLAAGFSSPIIDAAGTLMGNLVQLAQGQTPGATLISISDKVNSVWAIFKLLENQVNLTVISNPFLVTVNNYAAQVSLGETRRVKTGEVQSQLTTVTEGDVTANLTVQITPLINSAGNINLQINISVDSFTDATDPTSATRDTKTVKTNANVGNGEVLAIGGLLKTNENDTTSKVPLLGDIPLFGWLFKNKTKLRTKDNLLIFISPRVIEPKLEGGVGNYTLDKTEHAKHIMRDMRQVPERRDIIHRWFFKDRFDENNEYIDNFVARKNQGSFCDLTCSKMYANRTTIVDELPEVISIEGEAARTGVVQVQDPNQPPVAPREIVDARTGNIINVAPPVQNTVPRIVPVEKVPALIERPAPKLTVSQTTQQQTKSKTMQKKSRTRSSFMKSLPEHTEVAA